MWPDEQHRAERGGKREPPPAGTGPIVVNVDGSGSGWEAVAWADREAERRGLTVRVLSGMGPERFLAASREASLIVVGSAGLLRMRDLAQGSPAMAVAVHASSPVIVVRPGLPGAAPAGTSDDRVVVGVDGEVSAAAVRFGFAFARDHGCGLTLVHAVERAEERDGAGAMLAELSAEHAGVRAVVVVGAASHALIEESAGARLVVVGSRGHGGLKGLLLGSVSQAVLHRARCPVALVRSPGSPGPAKRLDQERGTAEYRKARGFVV